MPDGVMFRRTGPTCPCCGEAYLGPKVTEWVTDAEAERGWQLLRRMGWTAAALLAEHSDFFDMAAPGMNAFLRRQLGPRRRMAS